MSSISGIPSKMKGVVCYAPGDYRMEELDVPTVGPEEVLVKVTAVGICAGDAKCYAGAPLFWGDKDREPYCQPPIVPGHEFIGEVAALGPGAAEKFSLELGDQAIAESIAPCWNCRYCQRGQYHMCMPHDIYGFHQRTPGAMAGYMKYISDSIIHKVPKSVPPYQAAFIEPLACSIHAVERGNIQFRDVVVVSGCGPLGLGMVAAAKQKNPAKLIALDMFDWKLDIAKKCGADVVLNPGKCDVIAEVKKMTDGYGCDVYIEVSGSPVSVKQGLHMIAKLGTFVEFSVFKNETSVDWTIIGDTKELTIHGGHLGYNTYPKAISMLANKELPIDDIISHQLPLSDVVKGIDLVNSSSESIKVVLIPE
ncbi:erythritol/L-threitol dehydrogenase-like [Branchiostoma floridae]|uniref:Erythritol/L-threitol dehydrogenase-like n=1 Tax=Branchiostoma floridae TaxID=7739 RepID=A0A9J7LPA2_BRAFL|nr:erythritol/L-threitol dehydrogenase-like [Branchiostoma floridae]